MESAAHVDRSPQPELEDDLRQAVDASNLRRLRRRLLDHLFTGARRLSVPAGKTIRDLGHSEPHVYIVVGGLVRVYVAAPDGRTMTIRYCRPGALLGVATLYSDTTGRPFAIQALVDSQLHALDPRAVRRLADQDPLVAGALLTETSERVLAFAGEIAGSAFASVRQRVARHLLDLASEQQVGGVLVARVSQAALADAAGTAREVVVRCLREMRAEGIVQTTRAGIVILQPERLLGAD